MRAKLEPAEQVIARIASRAHEIVTPQELTAAAGITRDQIKRRVKRGLLIKRYRRLPGWPLRAERDAEYMAAVKACAPEALLCGKAAAFLLG